jgi:hypothetical protein
MHTPPEGWYPGSHVMPQVDWAHDGLPFGVPGHASPHVLQLAALVVTSTHDPLQFVRPPVQEAAHALWLHTWDGGQVLEQYPQWSCALVVSVSHPSSLRPSQSPQPPLHAPMAHALAAHAAVAFGIAHGSHDTDAQPYRGSSIETHEPEQSLRPAGHPPLSSGGTGARSSGASTLASVMPPSAGGAETSRSPSRSPQPASAPGTDVKARIVTRDRASPARLIAGYSTADCSCRT